jgi:hypothetical protein
VPASLLKTDPKYGYFPWWPEDGNGWVHPEDVAQARSLIPSDRIFRRDSMSGKYHLMHYGATTLRVRPALWQEVPPPAFEIGDWVEVLSRGMRNERRVGLIRDIVWDDGARDVRYRIAENEVPLEQLYSREDLQGIEPL